MGNLLARRCLNPSALVFALLPLFLSLVSGRAVLAQDGRCTETVGRDFPVGSPSKVGLSAERLLHLNDALEAGKFDIRGLLILRECQLVFERYKEGIDRQNNHSVYSVTKSFSSTLVGALLHQGKLRSVDTLISNLVDKPSQLPQEKWQKAQQITLRNVMQMSSGIAYTHQPSNPNHPIYAISADRFQVALSADLVAKPGAVFNYSDGDVSVTGAVIAQTARQDLYGFARATLFDPMQMQRHDWMFVDAVGRYPGGWGLRLRPMDMLKLGQLYLQLGEWNGRRIFDQDYVKLATAPGVSASYGLHWWIGTSPQYRATPYFFADGLKGQRIYVFPTLHIVTAMVASLTGEEERTVTSLVVGEIIAAAKKGAVEDAKDAAAALMRRQALGFNGQTNVEQREQDNPR